MADSFFGFDTTAERDALDDCSEEEEEDYDALNDETFGGDVLVGDWEENHEKLSEIAELSRHKEIIQENGDLSAKIAAFILDDEPHDLHEANQELSRLDFGKPSRPPPGFTNVTTTNHQQPQEVPIPLPPLKNMCTVEEIERNLIKQQTAPSLLEDIERNIISKQHSQQLVSLHHHPFLPTIPRHHPLLNNLPKLPSIAAAPFPLAGAFPHPFAAIQSGALRVNPQQPPPPLLRLAPLRPPPSISQSATQPPRLPLTIPTLMPPPPHVDEYAGLMTQKEKQWLASIQLMQISTNNPFQDDYYYMMYQHRQSGAHGRKGNVKLAREAPTLTKATYTPLQFENSLGKLQVGSVMAPRKIIDTDVVESVESHISLPSSKKYKQILLEIEQLFTSILAAEEVISPLTNSPLENVNPTEIFTKAVNTLLKEDKLRTVLSIRKGKTLVLRILPHTGVSDPLAERLISILPMAIRRDPEQALLRALPSIRHYLSSAGLVSINNLTFSLQPHLASLLENKFGISVMTNMIERAEGLLSAAGVVEGSDKWLEFMSNVVSTCSDVGMVERPVVGIQLAVLSRHLQRLPSSPTAQILQKAISISNT